MALTGRMLSGILAAAICLAGASSARAAPSAAPLAAYTSGRFLEAAETAGRSPLPEDRALAARALLAACVMAGAGRRDDLLDEAAVQARAALKGDPRSVEARLQLAMALGIKGRRSSVAEALRHGYAQEGKRLIDEALALSPNEPWAWALLGGWNLEIVRRGGRLGARLYGASIARGVAAFTRAGELAPNDPGIALHFAAALLGVDPVGRSVEARGALARASGAPDADAFAGHLRAEARRVAAVFDAAGPRAAAADAQTRL